MELGSSLVAMTAFLGSKSFLEGLATSGAYDILKKSGGVVRLFQNGGLRANHDLERVYVQCLRRSLKLLDRAVRKKAKEISHPTENYSQFWFSTILRDNEQLDDFLEQLGIEPDDVLDCFSDDDNSFADSLHLALHDWAETHFPEHAKVKYLESPDKSKLPAFLSEYILDGFPNPGKKGVTQTSFYHATNSFFIEILKNPKNSQEKKAEKIFERLQIEDVRDVVKRIEEKVGGSKGGDTLELSESQIEQLALALESGNS